MGRAVQRGRNQRFRSVTRSLAPGAEIAQGACRDFAFPAHVHEGLTLGSVVSGREYFQIRDQHIPAGRGAVYIVPPDTMHGGYSYQRGGWRYISLYITPDAIARLFDDDACSFDLRWMPTVQDTTVARALAQSLQEMAHHPARLCVDVALVKTVSIVCSANVYASTAATLVSEPKDRRLRNVRDFIDAHFQSDISLEQLATVAGWSRQHLIATFKKHFGGTPYAYLVARRLTAARKRILAGDPLAIVAVECGFCDQSHLNRHFVRVFGQSPAAYARSLTA